MKPYPVRESLCAGLVPLHLHPHRCPRGHHRPSPRPTRPPSWAPPLPLPPPTFSSTNGSHTQWNPNAGEIHFDAQAITLHLRVIARRCPSSAYGPTGAARRLRADTHNIYVWFHAGPTDYDLFLSFPSPPPSPTPPFIVHPPSIDVATLPDFGMKTSCASRIYGSEDSK